MNFYHRKTLRATGLVYWGRVIPSIVAGIILLFGLIYGLARDRYSYFLDVFPELLFGGFFATLFFEETLGSLINLFVDAKITRYQIIVFLFCIALLILPMFCLRHGFQVIVD